MYLRSIKLTGFKSFADRTRLDFERGVSVVVGPNGSGKSNVVDGLAWVMGTQSPRSLRTGRMEDVIFAGTATRPQLGRAEVTLVLDNVDRALPIDLAEVSITRRLYRDGSSDYEINGADCRLLDVQELLADSGVGRHQHVIVGQGQLTEILNAKPEDHRAVIEEAAGILKHRLRKDRALRRLERTDGDVVRLEDILRELRRQLRPLKRQADDAARHDDVRTELLALRRWLGAEELRTTDGRIAALGSAEARLTASLAADGRELADRLEALAPLEVIAGRVRADLDRDTTAAARLETLLERIRSVGSLASERRRSLSARLEGADERRADLELEHSELLAGVEERRRDEARAAEAAEAAEGVLGAIEDELQSIAEHDRLPDEGALVVVRSEARGLEVADDRDRRELARIDQRVADLESRRDAAGTVAIEAATAVGQTEAALADVRADSEASTGAVATGMATWESADAAARAAAAAHAAATSRRDALEAVVAGAADPAAVARAGSLGDRLGSIAEVLDVPADLAHAVDTALGPFQDALVFADGTDLAPIVDGLKRTGLGGVPLVAAHDSPTVIARMVAASWGVDALVDRLGSAANPGLAAVLLGDVVLVEGWQAGWEIVSRHPEVRAVTPDGDLLTAGAVSLADPHGATPAMVEVAASAAEAAALGHAEAGRVAERARDDLEVARRAAEEAERRRRAAETTLERSRRDLEAARREGAAVVDELAGLAERQAAIHAALDERHERLRVLKARLDALEGEEAERQAAFEAIAARRRSLGERRDRARSEVGATRGAAGGARERRLMADRRITEVEAELARLAQTSFDPDSLDRLEAVVRLAGSTATAARVHLDALRSRQVIWRQQSGDALRRLDDAHARVDDLRRRTEVDRSALGDAKVELAGLRVRREAVAEGLRRDADSDEATALAEAPPELPEGVDPVERVEVLAADLRRMGPINPLAAAEFVESDDRRAFMEAQLADLETSRREIRRVVEALDEEIERRFMDAFTEVASAFEDHVGILFPGGRGTVVLSDPDDPLGTGVDIRVQPIGKKVSRLSLLSGGEKSLAALAFLFAIFKARPSPFYVLDEVEAALDDANLRRFLRLVDDFRRTSQVVIITHQQQTMEAADVLYGVTMEPGGSSKVLSKRLGEDRASLTAAS